MAQDPVYRRNLVIVALLHIAVVGALFYIGYWHPKEEKHEDVMWLDGGGLVASKDKQDSNEEPSPTPEETPAATPEPPKEIKHTPPKENLPPSELVIPGSTPEPTPTPTP